MASATAAPGADPRLPRRLIWVADRLAARYGRPPRRRGDPLDALIQTVLSQNTSDLNSERAFAALKRAFPGWAEAAAAPASRVERAIRSGGLARVKSRRIRAVLAELGRREGRYDLSGLSRLSAAAADARLRGLPGVGPKTRACVLLFALGKPAFPVDTHVHRVATRFGLLCRGESAERAHAVLGPAVPRGRALDLHVNLIRLGRDLCRARAPHCRPCPLRPRCPTRAA